MNWNLILKRHAHCDIATGRLNRPSDQMNENLPKLSSNSDTQDTYIEKIQNYWGRPCKKDQQPFLTKQWQMLKSE